MVRKADTETILEEVASQVNEQTGFIGKLILDRFISGEAICPECGIGTGQIFYEIRRPGDMAINVGFSIVMVERPEKRRIEVFVSSERLNAEKFIPAYRSQVQQMENLWRRFCRVLAETEV